MLKLQRNRKEISIFVHGKDSSFNRLFFFALSVAVGLHLFAFMLFQIHSFFAAGDTILRPSMVEVDLNGLSLEDGITAYVEESSPIYLLTPLLSQPQLPSFPQPQFHIDMTAFDQQKKESDLFEELENDLGRWVSFDNRSPPPAFAVAISGELASIPLLNQELFDKIPKVSAPLVLSYAVQVERQTGSIFWYTPKQLIADTAAVKATEEILKNMQFAVDTHAFVSSGEVEFIFGGTHD